jgi:hypothetical protein
VTTVEHEFDLLDISAENELTRLDRLAQRPAVSAPTPAPTPWEAIRRRADALASLRASGDMRRLAAEFADCIAAVAEPADAPAVAMNALEEFADIVMALAHARGLSTAEPAR